MSKEFLILMHDWKGHLDLEQLKELEKLGIYVYEDPLCYGTDTYGFIFSKTPLTDEDLKKYLMREHDFSAKEAEEQLNSKDT